jgi:hypothetical protein
MNRGDRQAGRSRLEGLERDSTKAGYALVARRAARALGAASGKSAI